MSDTKWQINSLTYLGVAYLRLGGQFYSQFKLSNKLVDNYKVTAEIPVSSITFFDNILVLEGSGVLVLQREALIDPQQDTFIAIPKFLYDFELPFLVITDGDSIVGHILFFNEDAYSDICIWRNVTGD